MSAKSFRWVLLCVLWGSMPPLEASCCLQQPPGMSGVQDPTTLYVQVTRRQTRHPVCMTVRRDTPSCLSLPDPAGRDVDQHQPPQQPHDQPRPSASLRVVPTVTTQPGESTPELEASFKHPRYLHFAASTPVRAGRPGPVTAERLVTREDGNPQPHGLATVYVTVTRVEQVMDYRVTATLEASNCAPIGSGIPLCQHQRPANSEEGRLMFGLKLPWFLDFLYKTETRPTTSSPSPLPSPTPPPTSPLVPSTSEVLEPTLSLVGSPAKVTSSASSHKGLQEQQKPVPVTGDQAPVHLPAIDPGSGAASISSPGGHDSVKGSPGHSHKQVQLESSSTAGARPSGTRQEVTVDTDKAASGSSQQDYDLISTEDVTNERYVSDDIQDPYSIAGNIGTSDPAIPGPAFHALPTSPTGQDPDRTAYRDFPADTYSLTGTGDYGEQSR